MGKSQVESLDLMTNNYHIDSSWEGCDLRIYVLSPKISCVSKLDMMMNKK